MSIFYVYASASVCSNMCALCIPLFVHSMTDRRQNIMTHTIAIHQHNTTQHTYIPYGSTTYRNRLIAYLNVKYRPKSVKYLRAIKTIVNGLGCGWKMKNSIEMSIDRHRQEFAICFFFGAIQILRIFSKLFYTLKLVFHTFPMEDFLSNVWLCRI